MQDKIFYKIFLEATAVIALLAGLSFCVELLLPGVISLSQKTFALLMITVIMVITARKLSLTHPYSTEPDLVKKARHRNIIMLVGALALVPLYITTQNFPSIAQAAIIFGTLAMWIFLLKDWQSNSQ